MGLMNPLPGNHHPEHDSEKTVNFNRTRMAITLLGAVPIAAVVQENLDLSNLEGTGIAAIAGFTIHTALGPVIEGAKNRFQN